MTSPAGQTGLAEYSLALRAGTMLADQYTIVGVLGRPGGFGITYLAEDIRLESLVAIKEFLPRELATRAPDSTAVVTHSGTDNDGGFRHGLEQFLREARTLAKIHHPSVVRVRQFFEANGTAYLVMDYLEGQTLNELLKQEGGRLPVPQAVEIINRVLDGLRAAHALNIYHRDVKPSNIYITTAGLPVLLDFGAARQATGATSSKMTAVLTPGFAPLEQYGHRGQGPWTDIYAASAVLYHMITGVDPVPATDRVGEDVDPMLGPADIDPDIGQPLSDAIMKGLAMAARNRPQTADEFQRLLTAALVGTPPSAMGMGRSSLATDTPSAPVDSARVKPTSATGGSAPFIPSLADTLGPADIASPDPLRPAASGAIPVMPIVPSLANTLGPADLPRPTFPPTNAPSGSPPSVPSLADTVAAWRVTPSRPPVTDDRASPTTSPAPIVELPVEPSVAPIEPPADAVTEPSAGDSAALFLSDAFNSPPDMESPVTAPGSRADSSFDQPVESSELDTAAVRDDTVPVGIDRPDSDVPFGIAAGSEPVAVDGHDGARPIWVRATDTRQKRIGLAAAALVVLVGSGIVLKSSGGSEQVVVPAPDTTTKVSTGETTPAVDSTAYRDSLLQVARRDSIARADSTAKAVALAAKVKDSVRLASRAAAGRSDAPGRGAVTTVAPNQDSARAADAAAQQAAAAALAVTAAEHLRAVVDEFATVLRSRDDAAIAAALGESDKSADARANFLKFAHDRRPEVASVTPAEVTLDGDAAHQYFTVKFFWREGRVRRSEHMDYSVFRATVRHYAGKWTADKPEITRPPESK